MENIKQIAPKYFRIVFVILFSMVLCFHQTASAHGLDSKYQVPIEVDEYQDSEGDDGKDGNDGNDGDDLQIRNGSSLIVTNANLQIVHVFYEIMSIEYDEISDGLYDVEPIKVPDSYTLVLFRRLISPNAP